jgi:hypothetical protein
LDGRVILKWILKEIEWEPVKWVNLAQDRDKLRGEDVVNTTINLKVDSSWWS